MTSSDFKSSLHSVLRQKLERTHVIIIFFYSTRYEVLRTKYDRNSARNHFCVFCDDNAISPNTSQYVCTNIAYSKSKDQPGDVANPARGQLNRVNEYFQGFTWTTKISTGRDGGKIDGSPTFFISAGARDWQNIGVEIFGGTGRDGIFLGKILGGTGRLFFVFEAGRGGCFFFPRRDGAVVFFSRSGTGRLFFFFRGRTGRLFFFPEAGRGGCIFFSRRDGTGWLCFFSAGTGRLYFLFAPGRAFFF